ncbi:hypothetical protein Pla175_24860 [Pirellulimonas nuda]|uniref:Uncharacterized protein n=1 Tax=Pirellulimonas nuda TaxID=2528009 RepID=A0A518DCB7_9BACT|nr:hypothetical protein [Pirellulimonas nuda]QDU89100.1 hypothetical protein Pla175_24860 [Pirellulimonas nuda]
MVAASKPHEGNRLVQNLKKVVQQADRSITWAVFADDDPLMLRRLGEALGKESAAIIPAPQNLWSCGGHALEDAVVWAINELAVVSVVLVGSSAAGVPVSDPILAGRAAADESENTLLASVRASERKRRLAQEDFSQQVQSLVNVHEVGHRVARGSLALHCLFYRAESGVFTAFDPRDGSFRALIN